MVQSADSAINLKSSGITMVHISIVAVTGSLGVLRRLPFGVTLVEILELYADGLTMYY